MHEVLLTHQIVPGKFSELSDWFKEADAKRKVEDPDYKPPKRYIYQTGSVFKIASEFEFEKLVIDDVTPFSQGGIQTMVKLVSQISFHSLCLEHRQWIF